MEKDTANGWQWWNAMPKSRQVTMLVLATLIVVGTAIAGWLIARVEYRVLFSELSASDAGTVTSELEKMKVPFRLEKDGTAVLVAEDAVHRTRLKLMSKDLPLHGAVGFELFNNADFGMTDFAQRVNFQRAMQGELTRTILSIEEVSFARIHIVLAEQGLFRKSAAKQKASVTIGMKRGKVLRAEQIKGIQNLVAAALPETTPDDVTIADQRGVLLSRAAQSGDLGGRVDVKREVDEYLAHKVSSVLESTFGAGNISVSVDVTLNFDELSVRTEDILPGKGLSKDGNIAGVVTKEKHSSRPETPTGQDGTRQSASANTVSEVDYALGKRIESVVTKPGTIRRISAAVVVNGDLDDVKLERVREVVASVVGASRERGDVITVAPSNRLQGSARVGDEPAAGGMPEKGGRESPGSFGRDLAISGLPLLGLVFVMCCLLIGAYWAGSRRSSRRLSSQEREAVLAQLSQWVAQSSPDSARGGKL